MNSKTAVRNNSKKKLNFWENFGGNKALRATLHTEITADKKMGLPDLLRYELPTFQRRGRGGHRVIKIFYYPVYALYYYFRHFI